MKTLPRVEILNTGTELLLGSTLNTHGAWLGGELLRLGLRVERQTTVPDGPAIKDALSEILPRTSVLIVTGGLGPTSDDVTREALAAVLGLPLVEDARARREVEAWFAARQRPMAEDNLKQALVPAGAEILPNPNGTAPGLYLPPGLAPGIDCAVFVLPGPPREMHPMFFAEAVPRLTGSGSPERMRVLRFTGIGESDFHQGVDARLAKVEGLEIGYCAHVGEVELRLMGKPAAVDAGRAIALASFSDFLVSEDGATLEEVVVRMCTEKGITLATAESCTGGMIANRLTDVAGASAVFAGGFVTYANAAKTKMLGVPPELIDEHGAVSEAVARAMADGARVALDTDFAVAVTGIAGPGGGTPAKPVGTAWLALAGKGRATEVRHVCQPRNRADFKQAMSQIALDMVRRALTT